MERPKYYVELRQAPDDPVSGETRFCMVAIEHQWYEAHKDDEAAMQAHGLLPEQRVTAEFASSTVTPPSSSPEMPSPSPSTTPSSPSPSAPPSSPSPLDALSTDPELYVTDLELYAPEDAEWSPDSESAPSSVSPSTGPFDPVLPDPWVEATIEMAKQLWDMGIGPGDIFQDPDDDGWDISIPQESLDQFRVEFFKHITNNEN